MKAVKNLFSRSTSTDPAPGRRGRSKSQAGEAPRVGNAAQPAPTIRGRAHSDPPPPTDPKKGLAAAPEFVAVQVASRLTALDRAHLAETSKKINAAITKPESTMDPLMKRVFETQQRLRLLKDAKAPEATLEIAKKEMNDAAAEYRAIPSFKKAIQDLQLKFQQNEPDQNDWMSAARLLIAFGRLDDAERLLRWSMNEYRDPLHGKLLSVLQLRMGKNNEARTTIARTKTLLTRRNMAASDINFHDPKSLLEGFEQDNLERCVDGLLAKASATTRSVLYSPERASAALAGIQFVIPLPA
jgi:tetratricopeptide (TPR) repeat protein